MAQRSEIVVWPAKQLHNVITWWYCVKGGSSDIGPFSTEAEAIEHYLSTDAKARNK